MKIRLSKPYTWNHPYYKGETREIYFFGDIEAKGVLNKLCDRETRKVVVYRVDLYPRDKKYPMQKSFYPSDHGGVRYARRAALEWALFRWRTEPSLFL